MPLEVNPRGGHTNLRINGNLRSAAARTWSSRTTYNRILGVNATDVLTVPAGRTISGAGHIGLNAMGLVNQGTIDANGNKP